VDRAVLGHLLHPMTLLMLSLTMLRTPTTTARTGKARR